MFGDVKMILKDEHSALAIVLIKEKSQTKVMMIKNKNGWVFPKGHIEENETEEDAAIRECYEELGITIKTDKLFADITKEDLHISFFICRIVCGVISQKEHQNLCWITKEKLSDYTFCPADTEIVEMLKNDCE